MNRNITILLVYEWIITTVLKTRSVIPKWSDFLQICPVLLSVPLLKLKRIYSFECRKFWSNTKPSYSTAESKGWRLNIGPFPQTQGYRGDLKQIRVSNLRIKYISWMTNAVSYGCCSFALVYSIIWNDNIDHINKMLQLSSTEISLFFNMRIDKERCKVPLVLRESEFFIKSSVIEYFSRHSNVLNRRWRWRKIYWVHNFYECYEWKYKRSWERDVELIVPS